MKTRERIEQDLKNWDIDMDAMTALTVAETVLRSLRDDLKENEPNAWKSINTLENAITEVTCIE